MERAVEAQAEGEFALFGSGVSQDFVDYKLRLYAAVRPDITAVGSSRVMQFRAAYFRKPFLNMGGAAERYLPRLLPRLFDEDKDVRVALVDLLGQIGTSAVMPHLVTALRDENEWVRIRAIEALGVNKNTEAVPTLAQMLEHASPMVAFKIIEALGRIGGNVAFSVLLGMMDHEDPEIQHAAADAVSAIQAEQE